MQLDDSMNSVEEKLKRDKELEKKFDGIPFYLSKEVRQVVNEISENLSDTRHSLAYLADTVADNARCDGSDVLYGIAAMLNVISEKLESTAIKFDEIFNL